MSPLVKESLYKFLTVLAETPNSALADITTFCSYNRNYLQENPQYLNPFYLKTLEIFIKNQSLTIEDFKKIFSEISIKDPFRVNEGKIHYSSITNALVVEILNRFHPFFKGKITIRDNPLPRYESDNVLAYITAHFQEDISRATRQTFQKTPDFEIQFESGSRLYDLKMTKSTSYTIQRVSPLEYGEFNQKFSENYQWELSSHIKGKKESLSLDSAQKKSLGALESQVKKILLPNGMSAYEKNAQIHELLLNEKNLPENITPGIIVPTHIVPVTTTVSESLLDRIPNTLNQGDDKALIKGIQAAMAYHGPTLAKKACQMPGLTPKLRSALESDYNELSS